MSAAEIAAALGAARREGCGWRCRCPVHSGASLSVRDGSAGKLLVHCFAGCRSGDVFSKLRQLRLSGGSIGEVAEAPTSNRGERIAWARRLWDQARDACRSPVVRYLAGRGLTLPPPPSLRWAPRCWHREIQAWLPAMIGAVRNVDSELIGVHRTYLTADWRRRDRASLGPIAGGAVRLAEPRPGEWLVIGEGIETVLSIAQATGLPGWAALSAGGIERLVLPAAMRRVLICGDNDRNGTGEHAARSAAQRWLAEGREVRLALPPESGLDFNDMLVRGKLNG